MSKEMVILVFLVLRIYSNPLFLCCLASPDQRPTCSQTSTAFNLPDTQRNEIPGTDLYLFLLQGLKPPLS